MRTDGRRPHDHEADDRTLLSIGIAGALIAAICCFTPALVILLGAVGLSAVVGWWLDLILLPALVAFLALTVYALVRQRRRGATESAGGGPPGGPGDGYDG